ncbi:MAG: GTP-binding protein [Lentisphaerae bacterium]|nr:GTP-binding protein [Lentisphaerota bacterium]
MIKRKICMLGAYAVGKTSLVAAFVSSLFSDRYLTTVGVKIEKKRVQADGTEVDLLIWDVQGEDETRRIPESYLRGAAGYVLVADGTRSDTLETARRIRGRVEAAGAGRPFVLLLNKADLKDEWEIDADAEAALRKAGWPVYRTSAKTGDNVEAAFVRLTRAMLEAG